MDFANTVLDIIFVFLTQIAIIFLIIIIPSILTILRSAGAAENSKLVFESMSTETIRSLIDGSALITCLKLIAGPVSAAIAPLVYETLKDRKKENRALLQSYLNGLHFDLRRLLFGLLKGLGCTGVLIGAAALISGRNVFHFAAESNTPGMMALHLISICLYCASQELLVRHYTYLKTAKDSVTGYIILTNLLFVFALCRSMETLNVQRVLSVTLLSILMTLCYLRQQNISANTGFRCASETLLFLFFGDAHFGNLWTVLLLMLLVAVEIGSLLLRKERTVRRNEELQ